MNENNVAADAYVNNLNTSDPVEQGMPAIVSDDDNYAGGKENGEILAECPNYQCESSS